MSDEQLTQSAESLLGNLNDEQSQAVFASRNSSVVVLAGAGTGKTRVLTARIAHLMKSGEDPKKICCVAFTTKAALVMRARLEAALGDKVLRGIYIGTMHGWCFKQLRKHANKINVNSAFKILMGNEQLQVLKKYCPATAGLDDRKLGVIRTLLSRLKCATNGKKVLKQSANPGRLLEIWDQYHQFCTEKNYLDFDDLIIYGIGVARVLESYRYLLIDEFQDINPAQIDLCKALRRDGFLFAVGDDDQSIYSFRGSQNALDRTPGSLLADAQMLKLEKNYRSSSNILAFSNCVIDDNNQRRPKTLIPAGKLKGQPVKFFHFETSQEENQYIAEYISHIVKNPENPYRYNNVAVISRTTLALSELIPQLTLNGIPYDLKGSQSAVYRPQIKFAFALLHIIMETTKNDPHAWKVALEETPKVGAKTVESIFAKAKEEWLSLYEACQADKRAQPLVNTIDFLREQIRAYTATHTVREVFVFIVTIIAKLVNNDPQNLQHQENIKILKNMAQNHARDIVDETLPAVIDEFCSLAQFDPNPHNPEQERNAVHLLTAHAAKGAEFDIVFVIRVENGSYPHYNANDIEEERRLFFVACTRAKKALFLTAAKLRKNEKTKQSLEMNVSRFLKQPRRMRLFENVIYRADDHKKARPPARRAAPAAPGVRRPPVPPGPPGK